MSEAGKAPTDPYIGQVIQGRYQVHKLLGSGGMGAVYLAEQVSIGRQVALKVLRREASQDNAFVRRFHHEARLAGVINHPRVVTIYDFGEIGDGNLFLVMEYVPGDTLRNFIQEQQPLSVQRAVTIALQIAEALQAVHRAGVLHRDIKPENVVVRDGDEIKLMDFGIARQLDSQAQTELTRLTQTGMLVGSPQYMAPEQIDGKNVVSERTDIYAWGTILYELLVGESPFAAPTWQAVLLKHLNELPQPVRQRRSEVPVDIEQIVMQALEKEPQRRQQNMGEVIAALRAVRWEKPAPLPKKEPQEESTKIVVDPLRRSRGLKMAGRIVGGLLLLVGIVIGGWILWSRTPPTPPSPGVEDDVRRRAEEQRKIEETQRQENERQRQEAAAAEQRAREEAERREAERRAKEEAERKRAEEEERKRTGEMVSVAAGPFFMGCNEEVDKECYDDEKPGQPVNVGEFRIDKTEVTVAQFAQCVKDGKCSSRGLTMPYWSDKEQPDWAWACNWGKSGRENHPINCVDWNQAKAYCEWAGKRLPTEAEWEKAARGTDRRKYPWGNQSYENVGKVANIADKTARKQNSTFTWALEGYDDGFYGTAPVSSFPAGASPFEALDMIGNVWEWTADWYDKEQKFRAVRGGAWLLLPQSARASTRLRNEPGPRDELIGMRCAR